MALRKPAWRGLISVDSAWSAPARGDALLAEVARGPISGTACHACADGLAVEEDLAGPQWPTNDKTGDPLGGYSAGTLPAIAGWPHLTVPLATDGSFPVGMSFIGRAWDDGKLLMLGAAFERVRSPAPP